MIWSKRLETALFVSLRNSIPLEKESRDVIAYAALDYLTQEGAEAMIDWDTASSDMIEAKRAWYLIKLKRMKREEDNVGKDRTI